MEVRRGDRVDTIWVKGAMVQRTMEGYSFIVCEPFVFQEIMVHEMWIDNRTIKVLYRDSTRYTDL